MKKKGFTLAEVLLTMGIVGVVAALVLPTVIQNVSTSQVTPKLNKAISMFEQANTALLSTNKVDSLIDSGLMRTNETYGEELKKYLRLSKTDYGYLAKDGISYDFVIEKRTLDDSNPAHKQLIGLVTIDINGKAKPNEQGTDRFNYNLYNDGSLRETYRTAVNAEALEESDIKMVYLPEAVPSTNEEVVIKIPEKKVETTKKEEEKNVIEDEIERLSCPSGIIRFYSVYTKDYSCSFHDICTNWSYWADFDINDIHGTYPISSKAFQKLKDSGCTEDSKKFNFLSPLHFEKVRPIYKSLYPDIDKPYGSVRLEKMIITENFANEMSEHLDKYMIEQSKIWCPMALGKCAW